MTNDNNILIDKHGRLRSAWRALAFLIAYIFSTVVFGSLAVLAASAMSIDITAGGAPLLALNGILSLIPAILLGWAFGKLFESLPFRALGASPEGSWLKHFVLGSAVGTLTLGVAVGLAMAFGGLSFEINRTDPASATLSSLALSFLVFAAAAAFEEALFRGYILQTFARSGLAWLAIILTALFFGAVHAGNPNAGAISVANTVLAGIWFGVAYLKTRDLWFVWGLHLMWNFAQGSIFGIEVSGLTGVGGSPLLKEIDRGPQWLTGETYGIEGGIACTAALMISAAAIHFLPIAKPDQELAELNAVHATNGAPLRQ